MSLGNLLIHGLGGQQKQHLRDQYPKDVITASEGRAGFEGEEYWEQNDVGKSASIDRVVRVNTVSDQIRSSERGFWNGQKNQSLTVFSVTTALGVAAAVAAVAASTAFPPMMGVIVLTSMIAFTCFGFSSISLYRYVQAKDQYKQWEDPLPKLVEQRKQAGLKGFGYVYDQQLKDSLVTQSETQDLWHAQMEKTRTSFLAGLDGLVGVRGRMVRDFFESGLLNGEKLAYAFSGNIPANVSVLSSQYDGLRTQYTQLRRMTEGYKQSILKQKKERIRANDRQRDLQLAPWIHWFNVNYREPLERERNVMIIQNRGHRGAVLVSRDYDPHLRMYDARLERMNTFFQAMTAPIHELHERNRQQIIGWADFEIGRIQEGEDQQMDLFFQPVSQLVAQYNNAPVDLPSTDPLYPDLSEDLSPSAPPLEEDYQPPPFNPEWQSVVGEVDWERGVLEITTTRRVYR